MINPAVRKLLKVRYLLLIFSCVILSSVHAQQEKGRAIHANIIYHFTKYIDWPEHMKSGDFVIGVIDDFQLVEELTKAVANKLVGNQRIVVRAMKVSGRGYPCHILFISDEESDNLKKIIAGTSPATLVVSETEGAGYRGSCINFVVIDDRLRLEINKTNIEKRNLRIATELLQLGKVIK
jgi:hypothetical protein